MNKVFAAIISIVVLSGCSSMGVEPWDRDILAKEEMQLTTDAIEAATDDHIYFSKEASSGGRGFGGGGCGCN
jgi:outer membrane murein-binding lipoprotein Lpp